MKYPKISIVTPSFNDAAYVGQTLQSVIDQHYPNLEYVVIDGGSKDESVDIIKSFDKHLAYWVSEPDNGMYDALQKGFAKSTGDIMGWINSDDVLHKGSLFILAELFSAFPGINWFQGAPNIVDEHGRIVSTMSWPELSKLYFYKKRRNKNRYIQQESTYWRRSLWERAGAYISTEYRFAGDFELWMRFFQHEKLHNVNACLGAFRTSANGQASVEHFTSYVNETEAILAKFPLSLDEKRKLARMEFVDFVERRSYQFVQFLRRRIGATDLSVVNNSVYFDGRTQAFKINSR